MFASEADRVVQLWIDSEKCITKGLEIFEFISDTSNQALLCANLGGLMRLCAEAYHLLHEEDIIQREVSIAEEQYYSQAIQYYTKGQEILKRAKSDRNIWYSLESDLAAVHYTLAQQLQERPPLSKRSVSEVH